MTFRPLAPERLGDLLVEQLADRRGRVRVAVDGPPCSEPERLAEGFVDTLRGRGRDAVHVRAELFWRDASLRLEGGRHDPDALLDWLDAAALRREVLDPVGPAGTGWYLPSLRDPETNRSTREPARCAAAETVVLVSGALLLGRGLPFEVAVHLALSPAARQRRTVRELAWTLPAFARYDAEADPAGRADVVIRLDDPRHPAVRVRRPAR